jgi:hypothetical protein
LEGDEGDEAVVEECGYTDQWLRSKDSLNITAIKAPNPPGQQAAREKMIGGHFWQFLNFLCFRFLD